MSSEVSVCARLRLIRTHRGEISIAPVFAETKGLLGFVLKFLSLRCQVNIFGTSDFDLSARSITSARYIRRSIVVSALKK